MRPYRWIVVYDNLPWILVNGATNVAHYTFPLCSMFSRRYISSSVVSRSRRVWASEAVRQLLLGLVSGVGRDEPSSSV